MWFIILPETRTPTQNSFTKAGFVGLELLIVNLTKKVTSNPESDVANKRTVLAQSKLLWLKEIIKGTAKQPGTKLLVWEDTEYSSQDVQSVLFSSHTTSKKVKYKVSRY